MSFKATKENIMKERECYACGRWMDKDFLENKYQGRNKKIAETWEKRRKNVTELQTKKEEINQDDFVVLTERHTG